MDKDLAVRRLDALVRHINNVRANCTLLGERLIDRGEIEFGKRLIANGFIHDNSKFSGVEWMYLHQDVKDSEPEKFKLAAHEHQHGNFHHVEYWGHINEMPRIYVAELCCDITSRSQEFGQNIYDWLSEKGLDSYGITKNCKKYKEIKGFLQLLLEKPFQ